MKRMLRFSAHDKQLLFKIQVQETHRLLSNVAETTPATEVNRNVFEVLNYPSDAVASAIDQGLKGQLTLAFRVHYDSPKLLFDKDKFLHRFDLHPNDTNLQRLSNGGLIEVLRREKMTGIGAMEVRKRTQTFKKGECAMILGLAPTHDIYKRYLELPDTIQTAEEFRYLLQYYISVRFPDLCLSLIPIYEQLVRDQSFLDINEFAKALPQLHFYQHFSLRSLLFQHLHTHVMSLSPAAFSRLLQTTAMDNKKRPLPWKFLEKLEWAASCMDLDYVPFPDLIEILEAFGDLNLSLTPIFRKKLETLNSRFPAQNRSVAARVLAIQHRYGLDDPARIKTRVSDLLRESKEERSLSIVMPLIQLLHTYPELSRPTYELLPKLIQKASLVELQSIVQVRKEEDLLSLVSDRLLSIITPQSPMSDLLVVCEILGKLSYIGIYPPQKLSETLSTVFFNHIDDINDENLVTLAHHFSYISFDSDINAAICNYIVHRQQTEKVSKTLRNEDHYFYREKEEFHIPQNQFLNKLSKLQSAVLIISLLRGRSMEKEVQEVIGQYVKSLAAHFFSLTVKHRSSLLLGVSYRENFNPELWNLLVTAANESEQSSFSTKDSMRSLSTYRTAARNVKNLLRNLSPSSPQPLELCFNGYVLEVYSPKT